MLETSMQFRGVPFSGGTSVTRRIQKSASGKGGQVREKLLSFLETMRDMHKHTCTAVDKLMRVSGLFTA